MKYYLKRGLGVLETIVKGSSKVLKGCIKLIISLVDFEMKIYSKLCTSCVSSKHYYLG